MKKTTLITSFLMLLTVSLYAQSTATYSVNFTSNWSQTTHPHASGSLPGNAHWSRLVGSTHSDRITYLEVGSLATQGVQNIAETGNNTVFFSEVNAAITAGDANTLIEGDLLNTAGGQIDIANITTTEDFPLLTLLSMIAPSPDWMVAVNSVELLDTNGDWKDTISVDLFPYDAGTDSGVDYTSGNSPSVPHTNIVSAQGTVPFSNEKIGTLTVTLENVLGIDNIEATPAIHVFPNPSRGNIKISSTNSALNTIEIYSSIGKLVLSKKINTNSLDLDISHLPSGVYLLQTTDNTNKRLVKKLVKL